jgi:hypothetical protein
LIRTDSAGNKVAGLAHAEPPGEIANEIEVDATIIWGSRIEFVDEFATVVTDPTGVNILDQCKNCDRVRAAG